MKFKINFKTAALLAVVGACGSSSSTPNVDAGSDEFDRATLLASVGEIVLTQYRTFDQRAQALAAATGALCAALESGDEAARRAEARDAWKQAMVEWQTAELMQFGPVAMDSGAPRDRIYSWPLVSTCSVDQEVMVRWQNPGGYDITTRLVNRRGLAALEHLLFYEPLTATCPTPPAGWDALSDADKSAARCGLAAAAAADVVVQADALVAAWDPAAGNHLAAFTAAMGFGSAHEAVNVISDALFYVDSDVKDSKLGKPAGITVNSCGVLGQPCLADLESATAAHSKENILANLRGFQLVFSGGTSVGFDDFLRARGAPDLASQMEADIAAAIAKVEAIPGTLGEAVTSAPAVVAEAHASVKTITDSLKSQFLTVLSLEIPDDVATDND